MLSLLTCAAFDKAGQVGLRRTAEEERGQLVTPRKILACCCALILLGIAVRSATAAGVNHFTGNPVSQVAMRRAEDLFRGSARTLGLLAFQVSAGSFRLYNLAASSENLESTSLILFGSSFLVLAFLVRRSRASMPEM
jgi:hypothetical protein